MGCNTSRLDRLPAVALCRDRCKFLEEALRQSYALADAHVAHMQSLKALGPALSSFFHHSEDSAAAADDPKSELTKSPPHAASLDHASSSSSSSSSGSDSDSHMKLHSESEIGSTDKDLQFFNPSRYDYLHHDTVSSAPDDVVFVNYAQPLYPPFSPPLSNSKPPSPPPPSSTAWDFLNLFETFDKYEVPYSPSRDIKEEKDREGQRTSHQSSKKKASEAVDGSNNEGGKVDKPENEEAKKAKAYSTEKEQTDSKPKESGGSAKVKSAKGVSETMKEIQILFERASVSGNPILEILDVGKLRYHRKIAVNPVSCGMMHVFTPSVSSKPSTVKTGSGYQRVEKDEGYENMSSTLKKLSMWENKLYDEVKAEEKLHILHEKKCRQLSRMSKKGADAQKVDSIQTFIRILSTKMRISIQVVDKISNTICTLRDEELWPQINDFILRFRGMWKEMLECYKSQNREMEEAKSIEASSFNRKLISTAHVDAAIRLKSELQNWNMSFSDWLYAQKCHVKALNHWLLRCLLYDPEEIPDDGSAPFSPSKLGAPSVFIICNKWSQAVEKLSEKDVIEAVNEFISRVNDLLEKHILELQQKLTVDKELEKKVKMLERQEQKMHKVVDSRGTKMKMKMKMKMGSVGKEETDALLTQNAVHHAELFDSVSLQTGLKHIFAALESFAAITASAYEQLCLQIEQDNLNHHVMGESDNIH